MMEEFVTEEEEPWYDQQDLEQGELSAQRDSLAMPHSALGSGGFLPVKKHRYIRVL